MSKQPDSELDFCVTVLAAFKPSLCLCIPGAQLWKEQRVCGIDPRKADNRLQC